MTLSEELDAIAEHSRWLASLGKPPKEDGPRPRFKRCSDCPQRLGCKPWDGATSEDLARLREERKRLCNGCPYRGLPVTLSRRTHFALELAALPSEIVAMITDRLNYAQAVDLQMVRDWRASMRGGF